MLLDVVVSGVLAPAFVTIAVLLLLGRPRGAPEKGALAGLGPDFVPWALGLGYSAAHWLLNGFHLAPIDATNWLPHLALGAALVASIAGRVRSTPIRFGLDVTFAAGATWLLAEPIARQRDTADAIWLIGLAAVGLVAVVRSFERFLADPPALATGSVLALFAGALAAVAAASGTVRIGQLVGAGAATFGALAAASLVFSRPLALSTGARPAAIVVWGGALLAYLYAELQPVPLILLSAVPLVLAVLSLPLKKRGVRTAAQVAAALALSGVAGWQAVAPPVAEERPGETETDSGDGDDYDYGYGYE